MSNSYHIRTASLLFAVSLIVRLIAFWIVPEPHLSSNASLAYIGGAHTLIEGSGLRDSTFPVFTPPLYAMLIAGLAATFGDVQTSIKIAQVVTDSLTTVVVYFIALEVFGIVSAVLSGAILSVYPFAIYATLYIGAETFFTLFLSIFVLLVVYGLKYGRLVDSFAAGIAVGLATLTRGTTQVLPFLLPMAVFLCPEQRRRWLLHCGIILGSCVLVVLPWSIRNYLVLHEVIPVAAVAGGNFLYGSAEQFWTIDARETELPRTLERLRAQGVIDAPPTNSSPVQADRYAMIAGVENYKMRLQSDPVSLIPFAAKKLLRIWYATESGNNHAIIIAINAPLYLSAIGGVILSVRARKRYAYLLLGLLAYFVGLHLVMVPMFRYMLPVMPYVIAFASYMLAVLIEWAFPHQRWLASFQASLGTNEANTLNMNPRRLQ